MILIRQPAIAINDARDSCHAHLWRDYSVQESVRRTRIIEDVERIARSSPSGRVLDMVICCHGEPGHLILGEGFVTSHTPLFTRWQGLVERIYIRACGLARISAPNVTVDGHPCSELAGNGDQFCKDLARNIGCTIIASTEWQHTRYPDRHHMENLPYGFLDNYEGLVMWYGPQGQVLPQSRRFPSSRNDD